jgi:hypothetical protein
MMGVEEEQLRWATILEVSLKRVPDCRRFGADHQHELEKRMADVVDALWKAGWLPCRHGKRWISGLHVHVSDYSTSIRAWGLVGPKPPSRYRPEYSHFISTSTWNQ